MKHCEHISVYPDMQNVYRCGVCTIWITIKFSLTFSKLKSAYGQAPTPWISVDDDPKCKTASLPFFCHASIFLTEFKRLTSEIFSMINISVYLHDRDYFSFLYFQTFNLLMKFLRLKSNFNYLMSIWVVSNIYAGTLALSPIIFWNCHKLIVSKDDWIANVLHSVPIKSHILRTFEINSDDPPYFCPIFNSCKQRLGLHSKRCLRNVIWTFGWAFLWLRWSCILPMDWMELVVKFLNRPYLNICVYCCHYW